MSEIRLNLHNPDLVGSRESFPGHDMLVEHGGAWMFAQWSSERECWNVNLPTGSSEGWRKHWPQGCVFFKWVHEDAIECKACGVELTQGTSEAPGCVECPGCGALS